MAEEIIQVVTFKDTDAQGYERIYASHGINLGSGLNVVLPQERIETIAKQHPDYGWILK